MELNIKDLQNRVIELHCLGIDVDIEIMNQMLELSNIEQIKDGDIPMFTYTDYVRINKGDWFPGESLNTIAEAIYNGIKRAEEFLKTGILEF